MKILPNENTIYKKRGSFKAFFDCYVYSRKYKEVSSAWLSWFIRLCLLFLVFAMWIVYGFYGIKTDIGLELIKLLLCIELNIFLIPLWIQAFKYISRCNRQFDIITRVLGSSMLTGFAITLIFITFKNITLSQAHLLLGMFCATLIVILSMLYWLCKAKSSLIIITNKRMLIKTGIIFQDSTITDLKRIATIDVKQSVTGSIFGCGALAFHGYGIGGFCLPFMSNPTALRDEILKAQSGITNDEQKIYDDALDEY